MVDKARNDETSSRSADSQARYSAVIPPTRRSRNASIDETKGQSHDFPTLARHREIRALQRAPSPNMTNNISFSLESPNNDRNSPRSRRFDNELPPLRSVSPSLGNHPEMTIKKSTTVRPFVRVPSDSHVNAKKSVADADHSTHSDSSNLSVRERRRSIQLQSSQLPPAFRNLDRSASPKGRNSSGSVDVQNIFKSKQREIALALGSADQSKNRASDHGNPSRPRRSKRPPSGASHITHSIDDNGRSNDRTPTPPTKSASSPRPKHSVEREISSPLTLHDESELIVNLIDFTLVDGDKSSVATYNAILESIALSDNPEAQKGLDVLATMGKNDVAPDARTWELINMCSKMTYENSENDEDDDIINSGREMRTTAVDMENDAVQKPHLEHIHKLSLCSSGEVNSRHSISDQGNPPRKPWRMVHDLSSLPPAFRSSILVMLRRNGQTGNAAQVKRNSASTSLERVVPPTYVRSLSERDSSLATVIPSVADLKRNFMPSTDSKGNHDSNDLPQHHVSSALDINQDNEREVKDKDFATIFGRHGVVKYMRPDGLGKAPSRKLKVDEKVSPDDEADGAIESIENVDEDSDISAYTALLTSIANSTVPDKANRAGKVLKKMKTFGIEVDQKTRQLLRECTQIKEKPIEPKPHELEYVEESVVEPRPSQEALVTPTQVVVKRVRFSEINSFRLIRRRRSIGSNERWDDPLTPPKRIQDPVDLAPGRFSSGLRDDRPAPPRRSNSLSSLLSASSHSARSSDRSSSSSESADSIFDDVPATSDIFKLPFPDSPETVERKQSGRNRTSEMAEERPNRVPASSTTQPDSTVQHNARNMQMPALPVRSSSNDQDIIVSSAQHQVPTLSIINTPTNSVSPFAPPPPVDDSIIYRTPPSMRKPLRRRSISGIERRADYPLTPPRRVSAPLEIFIAQEALKAKIAKEASQKEIIEQLLHPIARNVESQSTLQDSVAAYDVNTASRNSDNSKSIQRKGGNIKATKGKRRPTSASVSADDLERVTSIIGNVKPTKPVDKKACSLYDGLSPRTSSLMRHGEKMPEHWKLLKFRDEFRMKGLLDDGADHVMMATAPQVDTAQDDGASFTVDKSVSAMRSSAHELKRRTRERRSTARKSHSTNTPTTKEHQHGDASWQRVLQGQKKGLQDTKDDVARLPTSGRSSVN